MPSKIYQENSNIKESGYGAMPYLTFIQDRLYFTCFPSAPQQTNDSHFFSVDQVFVYQNFYADFGPLRLAHIIRFCSLMTKKLEDSHLKNKKIILYSSYANDKKANALFLMCTFMMLVLKRTPEEAHHPMQLIASTVTPFRDAGYGADTYHISILDCLKGLRKALDLRLLDLQTFDLEEYEYYERVEHGDLNWLIKDKFLAFASPHDDAYSKDRNAYPKTKAHPNKNILPHGIPWRLNDMVNYFKHNKVSTVIRLNHELYDRTRFQEQGIEHIELYFHDGSCPSDEILQTFLQIVEAKHRGPIAIHCKAGLGRTGSLIAAYLMKHYKFTASEIIGFLRIMRPGSVVGPQQNWLFNMQTRLWSLGDLERSSNISLPSNKENQEYRAMFTSASLSQTNLSACMKQQAKIETAVPTLKTTRVGQDILSIPVQPRKGTDGHFVLATSLGSPSDGSNPLMHAIDKLLWMDVSSSRSKAAQPATFASLFQSNNSVQDTSNHRYPLRSHQRSNPSSRSNSIQFDSLNISTTPRSNSNGSLKMKTSMTNSHLIPASFYRRKDIHVPF